MKTALYMPACNKESDPSKEFETEQEAWEYIFNRMCVGCKDQRALYLRLVSEGKSPRDYYKRACEYPACSAEWFVVDSDELKGCETFSDVLNAAGYTEVIYRRPDYNVDTNNDNNNDNRKSKSKFRYKPK